LLSGDHERIKEGETGKAQPSRGSVARILFVKAGVTFKSAGGIARTGRSLPSASALSDYDKNGQVVTTRSPTWTFTIFAAPAVPTASVASLS